MVMKGLAGWRLMADSAARYWRHTSGWEVAPVRRAGRHTAWVGVSPSGAEILSGGEGRGRPFRTAALAMAAVESYRRRAGAG